VYLRHLLLRGESGKGRELRKGKGKGRRGKEGEGNGFAGPMSNCFLGA